VGTDFGPWPNCVTHGCEMRPPDDKFGAWKRYATLDVESRMLCCAEKWCPRTYFERRNLL
jgi:hypothetical protein